MFGATAVLFEQVAAGFEFGDLLGGHFDGFAGAGVLGGAGFTLHNAEGAEADKGHFLAFLELLLNAVEASGHCLFGGDFGHAGLFGHCVNKFGFVHADNV